MPVALGTDSVINLPEDQAELGLTPWHDAKLLVDRDGLGADSALRAITTGCAYVLGLDPSEYAIEPGNRPRGLGIVPIPTKTGSIDVFGGGYPPMLIFQA